MHGKQTKDFFQDGNVREFRCVDAPGIWQGERSGRNAFSLNATAFNIARTAGSCRTNLHLVGSLHILFGNVYDFRRDGACTYALHIWSTDSANLDVSH